MQKAEIENRTKEILEPILDELGFDMWDVEYVKEGKDHFLRAYIDKDGGITIDDCVDVSRKLSDKLDEYDYIDDEYTLEVSSPGVERPLKKDVDFEKSIGKEVYIKLYTPIEITQGGSKANSKKIKQKEFTGTLLSYDKENVTISLHNLETSDTPENEQDKTVPAVDKTTEAMISETTVSEAMPAETMTFTRKDIALIRLYAEF